MRRNERWLMFCIVIWAIFFTALFTIAIVSKAKARDLGQWDKVDPAVSAWFRNLKQPGSNVSCCGEADSYFCDEHSRGDQVYCVINDDRDNAVLMRIPIANGTEIDIPNDRLNHDPNLVGRAIVFLSHSRMVYCFIGAGGA